MMYEKRPDSAWRRSIEESNEQGVFTEGMISQIGRVVERSRGSQSISVQPLFSTPRTLRGRDRPVDSY